MFHYNDEQSMSLQYMQQTRGTIVYFHVDGLIFFEASRGKNSIVYPFLSY